MHFASRVYLSVVWKPTLLKEKLDALKPICGKGGLALSSAPRTVKAARSLICSFL